MLKEAMASLKLVKFAEDRNPGYYLFNFLDPNADEFVKGHDSLLDAESNILNNKITGTGATAKVDLQGEQVPVDAVRKIFSDAHTATDTLATNRRSLVFPHYRLGALTGGGIGLVGGGALGYYGSKLLGARKKGRRISALIGALLGTYLGASTGGDWAGNRFVNSRNAPVMQNGKHVLGDVNNQLAALRTAANPNASAFTPVMDPSVIDNATAMAAARKAANL